MSKGKTILCQAKQNKKKNTQRFFFRILCRMDIYFKWLMIYQSGITMNITNN